MRLPALVDLTCSLVTELIGDYLEGYGLSTRERARFEQHLYACTWCMDYLHQLQAVRRATHELASEPAEVPESALLAMFRRAAKPSIVQAATARPPHAAQPRRAPPSPRRVRLAFKFLMPDGRAAVSGFHWPLPADGAPGAWVEVARPIEPCKLGIHACGLRQLSSWLHDTLWLIELEGALTCSGGVVAQRGRLVREVAAWRLGGALRFAHAAHEHALTLVTAAQPDRRAAALPCVGSAAAHLPRGNVALAAFCAAMSVARLRGIDHFDQRGYDAERRWQSNWIRRELALDALLVDT